MSRGRSRGRGRYHPNAARAHRASEPQSTSRDSTNDQDTNSSLRQSRQSSTRLTRGSIAPFSSANTEPLGLRRRPARLLDDSSRQRYRLVGETKVDSFVRPPHNEAADRDKDATIILSSRPTFKQHSPPGVLPSRTGPRDQLHTTLALPGQDRVLDMAPMPPTSAESEGLAGPKPSLIEVAKPYVFEEGIRSALEAVGMPNSREDQIRMNGVLWIDQVRRVLQL